MWLWMEEPSPGPRLLCSRLLVLGSSVTSSCSWGLGQVQQKQLSAPATLQHLHMRRNQAEDTGRTRPCLCFCSSVLRPLTTLCSWEFCVLCLTVRYQNIPHVWAPRSMLGSCSFIGIGNRALKKGSIPEALAHEPAWLVSWITNVGVLCSRRTLCSAMLKSLLVRG